jgi:hypothetical protein
MISPSKILRSRKQTPTTVKALTLEEIANLPASFSGRAGSVLPLAFK